MAHSNLTFHEAKNQIKNNSDVDQVSVHQEVQVGITAAPLQVRTAARMLQHAPRQRRTKYLQHSNTHKHRLTLLIERSRTLILE